MRHTGLTLLCVVVGVGGSGGRTLEAQERSGIVDRSAVSKLLERRWQERFVPGEVIVKRRAGALPLTALPSRVQELGFALRPRATAGGEHIYRLTEANLRTFSRRVASDRTQQALAELRRSADVEYAQLNYVLHIADTTPADPGYPRQWHYRRWGHGSDRSLGGINLAQAWDTSKGAGVVVAVIDTGILGDHPDIVGSGHLLPGYDMVDDPDVANDGDGRDDDPTDPGDECEGNPASWHGTHVAGTIGVGGTNNGVGVAGIAWEAGVLPVRALGRCGGTTADIADAIRWAAGLPVPGARTNANPAKVINLSVGGKPGCDSQPAMQSAIDAAVAAGATVVVAAGNSQSDVSGFTPAGCRNVVTVAASDARGRLVTRYSNWGAGVDLMAPGGDVERDDNDDGQPDGVYSLVRGGYAYYNGTSMAAPHVSGVAALYLAANPSLSPVAVGERLRALALPRSHDECPKACGAGLLNAWPSFPWFSFTPAKIAFENGSSPVEVTTTLTIGGRPLPGETLTFVARDPDAVSVEPETQVTDASGQAKVRVKKLATKKTAVRAQWQGDASEVPVVPSLSDAACVALGAMALIMSSRRRPSRRGQDGV